jgi:predicted TIM-barrel fold metal-dependent hydrolase/pimeloyl-ACP methyl ester carboxylesterase
MKFPGLSLAFVLATPAAFSQEPLRYRGPIIDVHLHGGPTRPGLPFASDDEFLRRAIEEMDRHAVVLALTSMRDAERYAAVWRAADSLRFIVGPQLAWDRAWPDTAWVRRELASRRLGVIGEMDYVARGVPPTDPRVMAMFALAHEFDVPIAAHTGRRAPQNRPPGCCPASNDDYGDPVLLRPILQRFPGLRLMLYHVGGRGDYFDHAIALMRDFPKVYADMSVIATRAPREIFHGNLRRLIQEGLLDRIMFGSDGPEFIGANVDAFDAVTFLTDQQKRDIFYNNATRFLQLDSAQVQRHRARVRSGGSASSEPRFEPAPCAFKADEKVLAQLRCGYVTVPENRATPNGRHLRLAVAIVKSTSPRPRPDPIVLVQGGPGSPLVTFVPGAIGSGRIDFLRGDRDLVYFDQRGIGYSDPEFCPALRAEWTRIQRLGLARPERTLRQRDAMARCRDVLVSAGVDLSQYNSTVSAYDLEDVRRALGYEQWNLLAMSYGTRVALEAMRLTPRAIRSVTIDGPAPWPDAASRGPSAGFVDVVHRLSLSCAAQPECKTSFPDVEQNLWLASTTQARVHSRRAAPACRTTPGDARDWGGCSAVRPTLPRMTISSASSVFCTRSTAYARLGSGEVRPAFT